MSMLAEFTVQPPSIASFIILLTLGATGAVLVVLGVATGLRAKRTARFIVLW